MSAILLGDALSFVACIEELIEAKKIERASMLFRMGQNIKICKFTSRCTDTNQVHKYKHQDAQI